MCDWIDHAVLREKEEGSRQNVRILHEDSSNESINHILQNTPSTRDPLEIIRLIPITARKFDAGKLCKDL